MTVEGYPGTTFSLTRIGTYEVLAEYTIQAGSRQQRFVLTEDNKREREVGMVGMPARGEFGASELREERAASCRLANSSCTACAELDGCG